MIKVILCIIFPCYKERPLIWPPSIPSSLVFCILFYLFSISLCDQHFIICQIPVRGCRKITFFFFSGTADWKWPRPSTMKHTLRCQYVLNVILVILALSYIILVKCIPFSTITSKVLSLQNVNKFLSYRRRGNREEIL